MAVGRFSVALSLLIMLLTALPTIAVDIESVIPAYSLGYLKIRDVPEIWDAMAASDSWRSLLSSDEISDGIENIEVFFDGIKEYIEVEPRELAGIFAQKLALVQVYADPISDVPPVLITEVYDQQSGSEMLLKIGQALAEQGEYNVQLQRETYAGVPFGLIRSKTGDFSVRYALLDNLLVVAFEQSAFEAILDVHLGRDPSLIYDPKFNRTKDKIAVEGDLSVYINLESLWSVADVSLDPELKAIFQILGITESKSFIWSVSLSEANKSQEAYLYSAGSGGLLVSLLADPKSFSSPHLVPASDADIFAVMHTGDPIRSWESIKKAIKDTVDANDYQLIESEFMEFERETGLNLQNDILAALTGEIGFYFPFSAFAGTMGNFDYLLKDGLVIFCGVRDRDKIAMSIERALSTSRISLSGWNIMAWRSMKYRL